MKQINIKIIVVVLIFLGINLGTYGQVLQPRKAWVHRSYLWGFVNKETGKEVIPYKYDGAKDFSEGLAAVKLNGKWGYIDDTGKEVIPLKYDNAWRFSNGLAEVKLNGKWGCIDKTDFIVVPFTYANSNTAYSAGTKIDKTERDMIAERVRL